MGDEGWRGGGVHAGQGIDGPPQSTRRGVIWAGREGGEKGLTPARESIIMKSRDNKRDAFEKVTGWLEHTEQMSLEELREIRRTMGHDVESSEKQFVAFLDNLTTNSTESAKSFAILSCAASKQLSLVQL